MDDIDLFKERIWREIIKERGLGEISEMSKEKADSLHDKTNKKAENEFTTSLFICMANNGRYVKLKMRLRV